MADGERKPIVDGIFYPRDKDELSAYLGRLFHQVKKNEVGSAAGLLVPHAAYEFIGAGTAAAYASVHPEIVKEILLIGPLHREGKNRIVISPHKAYSTPLGPVRLAENAIEKLRDENISLEINDIPHEEEHCLEVQLPFIKHRFPDAKIIPVLIGGITRTRCHDLCIALQNTFHDSRKSLLTVVTVNSAISKKREEALQQAESLNRFFVPGNFNHFYQKEFLKKLSLCGPEPLSILLHPVFEFSRIQKLNECRSWEIDENGPEALIYSAYSLYTM